jgi:manganese efflux pump family protein
MVRRTVAGLLLVFGVLLCDPLAAATAAGAGTIAGCTRAAVRAVRLGITIHALPLPCRGLRPLDVQRAAIIAIDELSGSGAKARIRHDAGIAGARLSYLLRNPRPGLLSPPRRRPASSAGPVAGLAVPVGLAALVAWALTVASGGYLLAGWIAHGGLRRGATGRRRLPPPVILAHFGLASAGLIGWVGYLISDSAPVAWLAVGLLLPVAGLGMATLMLAIPDAGGAAAGRSRMPVIAISAHGILATFTMLLVLLAAVAAR